MQNQEVQFINKDHVLENVGPHINPDLDPAERESLEGFLQNSGECREEFEAMMKMDQILTDLPFPTPSPDFARKIHAEIEKQNKVAFFASPISRFLSIFKIPISPLIANATAMAFYSILTVFLIKLTFFGENGNHTVPTNMKPIGPNIRIVKLGAIKKSALESSTIESKVPDTIEIR